MDDANPFTEDGRYDRSWTILTVSKSVQGMLFQQRSKHGCYAVSMNPEYPYFRELFADFLQYETDHNRKVILGSDRKLSLRFTTHYRETTVRPSDPRFLVHSTTLAAYEHIRNDGMLKSLARLRAEGQSVHPIGLAPLGEPDDYLDYIMFGGGLAPELVVNSRLCGAVNYHPDTPYTPQARLYFDGHKMVRDGLITRSVASMAYGGMPLADYLLDTVFAHSVPLPAGDTCWTPLSFSKTADAFMHKRFG